MSIDVHGYWTVGTRVRVLRGFYKGDIGKVIDKEIKQHYVLYLIELENGTKRVFNSTSLILVD